MKSTLELSHPPPPPPPPCTPHHPHHRLFSFASFFFLFILFRVTLRLMMKHHHHSKFGLKRLSASEVTFQTKLGHIDSRTRCRPQLRCGGYDNNNAQAKCSQKKIYSSASAVSHRDGKLHHPAISRRLTADRPTYFE